MPKSNMFESVVGRDSETKLVKPKIDNSKNRFKEMGPGY
jgi:hypothetical protein